jgi:hypothetical protein
MKAEDLHGRVQRHYHATEKPLLLSDFGKELQSAGLWPIEGDRRSLAETLAAVAPSLVTVADPDASAYVVVTLRGEEERADRAFEQRRKVRLLRQLPRSVLLAFCVQIGENDQVYLRKDPPYRYVVNPDQIDNLWPIEHRYRRPGLFIESNRTIPDHEAAALMQNVVAWADEHLVDLDALAASKSQEGREPVSVPVPARVAANALERLRNAQPSGLVERLVVPMDIAVLLSRNP